MQTLKQWLIENFSAGEIKDIADHGADCGWDNLTWYKDTNKLYRQFREDLVEILSATSEEFGYKNFWEYLLALGKDVSTANEIEYQFVKLAIEQLAYEFAYGEEEDD